MGQTTLGPITIEQFAENLATFAINQDDAKALLQAMPADDTTNRTSVAYELQILKILSVGWAIAFYMEETLLKKDLNQRFWDYIKEISHNLSLLMETTTGQTVDYFSTLKKRMDTYVVTMKQNTNEGTDPTFIMGPAFADACGSKDNATVILAGTKLFTMTLGATKEYLNAVDIQPSTISLS